MNTQEIFDKVWSWFIVERHHAGRGDGPGCRYFIDPQTKCAIGCLFSDEVAATLDPWSLETIAAQHFPGVTLLFLADLRGVHDSSACESLGNFYNILEPRFRRLAVKYGLTIPDEVAVEELIRSIEEVPA